MNENRVRLFREIPQDQAELLYAAEQRRMPGMRGLGAAPAGGTPVVLPVVPDAEEVTTLDPSGNYPIKVPWMLSKGGAPFPIKVERPFEQVINLPVKGFTAPQDFVLTAISCHYTLQTRTPGAAPNAWIEPETYEINFKFNNRTLLFTSRIPFQMIPERQHALLLPCPYYLPVGSTVEVEGLDQAVWSFRQDLPPAPLSDIWFGFYGYYVVKQVSKEDVFSLSRPLFYVQRFDLIAAGDTAQQIPLQTVRDADLFEVNRLISCALVNSSGAAPLEFSPNYYGVPVVHHGSIQARISNEFLLTNELNPWQVSFGTPEYPVYMSPPWRICPGSPIFLVYSDVLAAPELQYSYYLFGGKNRYDQ